MGLSRLGRGHVQAGLLLLGGGGGEGAPGACPSSPCFPQLASTLRGRGRPCSPDKSELFQMQPGMAARARSLRTGLARPL